MDGLECSEILLSDTNNLDNDWFRLDSHFYEKKYIKLKQKLEDMPHWYMKEIVEKTIQTGHTPSMKNESFYGGTIPLIKTDNLRENFITDTFSDYLSEQGNAEIERTSLQEDDIITTIIGATEDVIARSALVLKEFLPANINQNIVQIRINRRIVPPAFVNAYINSCYGRNYLRYLSRQTEQVNLNCKEIENVLVPMFSESLYTLIDDCTKLAHSRQQQSRAAFYDAQEILQRKLGFYENEEKNSISVLDFSKSFKRFGRLDAEYYQPKYDVYIHMLHTADTVNSLCNIYDKNYIPENEFLYKYIELANVGLSGEISNVEYVKGSELPTRARRRVRAGQVIVSSVEGSLQSCALITDKFDGALCSTGFYVLTSDTINSETLLVLFKSEVMQALLKQRCSGTILAAITKDDLLSMPLPKIDDSIQAEIAGKVQMSFSLRRQSAQLLEYAKRAVEMANEQGENAALAWLNSKVSNAEV